jgi:hypothetical protein
MLSEDGFIFGVRAQEPFDFCFTGGESVPIFLPSSNVLTRGMYNLIIVSSFSAVWCTVLQVINIVGNFGTVFVDQSYWQSAIAAKPSATYKGYILGGLCWFSIPFTLATSLGLASRALDLPVSKGEAGAGSC